LARSQTPKDRSISQRKQLGAALRSYRHDAGIDREAAAAAIDASDATLSRIERGETKLKRPDLLALAKAYKVPADERDVLVKMLFETRIPRGQYPAFFSVKTRSALALEPDATEILYAYNELVPAHFQTEDYMRALFIGSDEGSPVERIDRLVAARKARQEVLTQDNPPMFRAVLHQNVLELPVGGPAVMHKQLLRLADVTELPNVEIQIQPRSAGAYPGIGTTFMLLRFDNDTAADIVQAEAHGDSFYRDRPGTTEPFRLGWDRQRVSALSLPASKALILDAATDMERQITP
jgi:transcriptional regulator with XRE-family HTH domain